MTNKKIMIKSSKNLKSTVNLKKMSYTKGSNSTNVLKNQINCLIAS